MVRGSGREKMRNALPPSSSVRRAPVCIRVYRRVCGVYWWVCQFTRVLFSLQQKVREKDRPRGSARVVDEVMAKQKEVEKREGAKRERERGDTKLEKKVRYVGNGWLVDALHLTRVRPRKMSADLWRWRRRRKKKKSGYPGGERRTLCSRSRSYPVMWMSRRRSRARAVDSLGACELFSADMRLYRALIEYQTTAGRALSCPRLCFACGRKPALKGPNDCRTIASVGQFKNDLMSAQLRSERALSLPALSRARAYWSGSVGRAS